MQDVADNVQRLMSRLYSTLGLRNAILTGMPLTTSTPMVAHMIRLMLGEGACVTSLGRYTLRTLNAMHIAKLKQASVGASHAVVATWQSPQWERST